jgi:tetratricopeptide (TPR) repeat protein
LDAQQPAKARRPGFHPHVSIVAPACLLLVVGLGIAAALWRAGYFPPARPVSFAGRPGPWPQSPWLNTRPGVKYVGDAACARCHADIAETFRRHSMGRSLFPNASAPAVGVDRPAGTASFNVARSVFTIERRDGREIHRETVRDGGKVVAQVEAEVAYAVGSGARSISYFIERDGRLFMSPITWYTQKQNWDLSPGYEKNNSHFDRAIHPNCLFCHSNQIQYVPLTANRYKEPVFLGHAIGCERCHGPGELHSGRPELSGGRDLTIVNPKHLDPVLRGNVCEQCHLVGDERVERIGRNVFDYRPGLPLTEFFVDHGITTDNGQKLVGQVEQMKSSRCFRASQGRLGCISCHDPHELPTPEEKVAYFRERCLACHENKGCKLPEPVRLAGNRQNDCAGCHMPMAKAEDAVHIAVRDHRILRDPDTWSPGPRQSVSRLPLVRLDAGVDPEHVGTPDREQAIAVTAHLTWLPKTPEMQRTGQLVLSALDQAVAQHPDDRAALRMQAQTLAYIGRHAAAFRIADSLLKLTPTHELLLEDYTSYAIDLKNYQAALEPSQRAVALNPWSASGHERLAFLSIQFQDWTTARHEASEALRLNPFLKFARMFLIQCLLHDNDANTANDEFATLVKLHEDERDSLEQWLAQQQRR